MRPLSQSEASIQKRTSTAKFARSPCTDPQVPKLWQAYLSRSHHLLLHGPDSVSNRTATFQLKVISRVIFTRLQQSRLNQPSDMLSTSFLWPRLPSAKRRCSGQCVCNCDRSRSSMWTRATSRGMASLSSTRLRLRQW